VQNTQQSPFWGCITVLHFWQVYESWHTLVGRVSVFLNPQLGQVISDVVELSGFSQQSFLFSLKHNCRSALISFCSEKGWPGFEWLVQQAKDPASNNRIKKKLIRIF